FDWEKAEAKPAKKLSVVGMVFTPIKLVWKYLLVCFF
ncbi:unnamed protein product, partial [marine sediment metagenome]